MQQLRKWLPFLIILVIIAFSTIYLIFGQQRSAYFPKTDDPAVIYGEACSGCHGKNGEGEGLIYPALDEEEFTAKEVRQKITEGALFMPAFTHIHKDTLDSLVNYVSEKKFKTAVK